MMDDLQMPKREHFELSKVVFFGRKKIQWNPFCKIEHFEKGQRKKDNRERKENR